MPDKSVRYVIRIEKNYLTPFNRYLSIVGHDNSFSFEGIFLSHSIADIETVSRHEKLRNNSKVLLQGLNGYTTKGWATTSTGEVLTGDGVGMKKYIEPLVKIFNQVMDKTNQNKANNYPLAGGGEGDQWCIYHYEVWYIEETREILGIEYLGSDCFDSGGGGGDPQAPQPSDDASCDFTEEEAADIAASMGGDNTVEISGNVKWLSHYPESGRYERGATKEIKFYEGNSIIESNKHPYFVTQYAGTEYKIGDYDLFWKWVPGSVTYNGMVERGDPIACNKFLITVNHAPIIINPDGTKANAKFTYTGKQQFTCVLTVKVATIDGSVDVWLDAQTDH